MWIEVCAEGDIPLRGARRLTIGTTPVGVFRSGDGALFALIDRCPHRQGPLSQGIVHGRAVACPLHNWSISLETGEALAPDKGCTRTLAVKRDGARVLIDAAPLMRDAASDA
jgi:nitrite reductase (NADH) small subunit